MSKHPFKKELVVICLAYQKVGSSLHKPGGESICSLGERGTFWIGFLPTSRAVHPSYMPQSSEGESETCSDLPLKLEAAQVKQNGIAK